MKINKHFGMELKRIWFMKKEHDKLINAIKHKDKDLVFEMILKINEREDI